MCAHNSIHEVAKVVLSAMAPPFWQKFMSDFIAKTLGEFIADFDEKTFQLHDFNRSI